MGKIYDALKRAEKEATLRKNEVTAEDIPVQREINRSEPAPSGPVEHLTRHETEDIQPEQEMSLPEAASPAPVETITRPKPVNINTDSKQEVPQKRRVKRSIPVPKTKCKLFVLQQPHSIIAEQFRILRARLSKLNKEGQLRTIMVTSTLPGEGKSFISSNLAVSIAQSYNEHVLLVDADLRKPTQNEIFRIGAGEGLSTILSNESDLDNVLEKTDMPNLTILSSGPPPENPSELIASARMKQFVREVRSRYQDRYIIFDSTPTLPTPEPAIMAEYVDGIIVVVKAGKTSRTLVQETIKALGREKILGIVFNYSKTHSKSYGYYNYYSTNKKG